MKYGFVASIAGLLASAGLALAEEPLVVLGPADAPAPHHPCLVDMLCSHGNECIAPDEAPGRCSFWARTEYLLWWIKDGPLPIPLITTSSGANGLSGALGQPGTAVVLGGSGLDYRDLSGGRLTVGYWFDSDQTLGIEARGFLLERSQLNFLGNSNPNGTPLLAFPFFNVPDNQQDRFADAFPGLRTGNLLVNTASRFWGSEVNLVCGLSPEGTARFTLVGGFRYLDLDEQLNIIGQRTEIDNEAVFFLGTPHFGDFTTTVRDAFRTRNQFYGGQIGGQADYCMGKWFVSAVGKIAFGDTAEVFNVGGNSTLIPPPGAGVPVTAPGGRFALPTNSGRFTHDEFAVVPEVEVKLGYQVSSHLSASIGYDFLYWSRVARPGDQIDPQIDTRQVPTSFEFDASAHPTLPAPLVRQTDFWAQGLTFGLEFRY